MQRAKSRRDRARGFTLIELAITITIIAILLGGILTVSSLLDNAKVQDTIAFATDLSQAARDFRGRYGALPGDDPRATVQIAGVAGNGNGDGDIGAPGDATESNLATNHLVVGGFLRSADAAGRLQSRYGGVWIMSGALAADAATPCGTAVNQAGANPSNVRNLIVFAQLPARVALEIDSKHDDGAPNTGRIRASDAYGATPNFPVVRCLTMPL